MTRTLRLLLVLSLLLTLPAAVIGQGLTSMLPADVLGYIRLDEPYKAFSDMVTRGIGTARATGADVDDPDEAIAEGLGEVDGAFGLDEGTMMTWLRSVSSVEMALFEVEITGFIPEVEFAMVFRTPQAKSIYEATTKLLKKQQLGTMNRDGTMEVDAMGFWQGILGHRDDRLVLASDPDRLSDTMQDLSNVKAGGLAQSPHFKAMFGGKKAETLIYANLSRVLAMVRDEMPRADLREFDAVAGPLGLWDLEAFGYRQEGEQSWTQIRSSKTIPAFDYLSGPKGKSDLVARLPGHTVFTGTWPGELTPVWRKASSYFLDSSRFPGAARLTERLAGVQRFLGVEIPELVAAADGGVTFGFLPRRGHREEESMYGVVGLSESEAGEEMVARILENVAKRRKASLQTEQIGTNTWFRMVRNEKPHPLAVALVGRHAVIGHEVAVKEVASYLDGTNKQTIGRTSALDSIAPKASAFMTLNLAAAFAGMSPDMKKEQLDEIFRQIPCVGMAMDITPKALKIHSNRSVWTLLTTASLGFFAVASEEMVVAEAEATKAAEASGRAEDQAVPVPVAPAPTEAESRPAKPAPKPRGGGDGGNR